MLPSFILALREGLEAALIIGIVIGVLKKMRQTHYAKTVWLGVGSASTLSLVTALVIYAVGASFEGEAEEIFEGFVMLIAAGVLTWMIFWMQQQAKMMKYELEYNVRKATRDQGGRALFTLAFVSVLREGVELALFLTAATATSSARQAFFGGLLGLATAVILGWAIFASTIKLNLRRFFQVTGILLILFAAGLVAHGVHEFNEVGWIPPIIEHVWNINSILDENSAFGLILKALFGYNGNPSLTEVAAYGVYFLAILLGLWRKSSRSAPVFQEI
jgi:high-affinity iron transporter